MITTTHRAWRAIVGRVAATALVAALPALLPVSAFAQQSAAGRVTQVYVDKSGKFARVMLDAPAVNPGNCAGGDYYIVEFPADTSRGPMLAALYMALSQRLPVSMWVLGCTTVEYWGSRDPWRTTSIWARPDRRDHASPATMFSAGRTTGAAVT